MPAIVESLRLGLKARNPDYERGVMNPDSVLETLIWVASLPARVAVQLGDTGNRGALENLERYTAAGFRSGRRTITIAPSAWGQLLAYAKSRQ
jgi:hypothetical protein